MPSRQAKAKMGATPPSSITSEPNDKKRFHQRSTRFSAASRANIAGECGDCGSAMRASGCTWRR
jgi:hypothetical protein